MIIFVGLLFQSSQWITYTEIIIMNDLFATLFRLVSKMNKMNDGIEVDNILWWFAMLYRNFLWFLIIWKWLSDRNAHVNSGQKSELWFVIYRVFQNPAPPSRAQVAEPRVKSMVVGWSKSNLKLICQGRITTIHFCGFYRVCSKRPNV